MSVWMDYLFGCAHRKTSFPITHRRETVAGRQQPGVPQATYIVCLDCGKEFPYSWEKMKFLRGAAKGAMAMGAAAGSASPRG